MSSRYTPLRDRLAALSGGPPGVEVGAMCDRLDAHFAHQPLGVAALMVVVLLYAVDRFLSAVARAEMELSDAKLAFNSKGTAALSNEQHAIARMADALSKLQQENARLHHLLAARRASRWLSAAKLIVSTALLGGAVILGRLTA